jgi:hypothetical protein
MTKKEALVETLAKMSEEQVGQILDYSPPGLARKIFTRQRFEGAAAGGLLGVAIVAGINEHQKRKAASAVENLVSDIDLSQLMG